MKALVRLARFLLAASLPFAASLTHAGAPLDLVGFKTSIPNGWKSEKPENTMRIAQFLVPGKEPGNSVVFYFGKAGGGSVEANIQRWESNFVGAAGKPVKAVTRKGKAGAMPVTWTEINGSYARGVGMGVSGEVKANQTLLVAIVETPKGNLTFQLFGPKQTVNGQRKAFEAMVNGLK